MPISLRIHFTGLCLFTPERVGDDENTGRMHVLFPVTADHPEHQHIPILAFDAAHLIEGESPSEMDVRISLHDRSLVVGEAAANLRLCPEILNLRTASGVPVDPDQLGDDTANKLVTRVTLGAGSNDAVTTEGCWFWQGNKRRIAHQARWTLPDVTAPVQLTIEGLHGRSGLTVPPLYPFTTITGELVINLEIYYLPAAELPLPAAPAPERHDHGAPHLGMPPGHFHLFYRIFGPEVPQVLPGFAGKCPDGMPQVCPEDASRGATPFNCMVVGNYP